MEKFMSISKQDAAFSLAIIILMFSGLFFLKTSLGFSNPPSVSPPNGSTIFDFLTTDNSDQVKPGALAASSLKSFLDDSFYVDIAADSSGKLNGLDMSCNLDGHCSEGDSDYHRIQDLADPVDDQDIATKAYVCQHFGISPCD